MQIDVVSPHFFYMEVESEDSTSYDAKYGTYHLNGEMRVKKNPSTISKEEDFIRSVDSTLQLLPEDKRNILIYIHGMWAHRDFFQEEVLTRFREDVLSEGSSSYGLVISVIWHAGMNYFENAKHALTVGKHYSPIVDEVLGLEVESISVICHSMGNRVFQGIIKNIDKPRQADPRIDKAILIAADLEENIFQEGQPLAEIGKYVKSPIVYVHNNDRSLGMSKALNENDRLGLNADTETIVNNSIIKIIDVSTVDDNEGFGPSISNHRYFYTSPTVRQDLYYTLHGKDNPQRKNLDTPRRQKLTRVK